MYKKLFSWLFALGLLVAFLPLSAQTVARVEGQILGKRVRGSVQVLNNANQTLQTYTTDFATRQGFTIKTAAQSSVVLVFSNGATVNLGPESELNIEQFMQDEWGSAIDVAALTEEPSSSTTKLRLARGELVGNVKKLHTQQGSSFEVNTPVGAAGIRGTVFRVTFRVDPADPRRVFFSVATLEGLVMVNLSGSAQLPTGVAADQLVNLHLEVDVNDTTGEITLLNLPAGVNPEALPSNVQELLNQGLQQTVEAGINALFPPPTSDGGLPPAPPPVQPPDETTPGAGTGGQTG